MRKFTWTFKMQLHDLMPSQAIQRKSRIQSLFCGAIPSGLFFPFFLKLSGVLILTISAFLIVASPRPASGAINGFYHIQEVKPHVFVWVAEDVLDQEGDPQYTRAGNAGFIITQDGVVVVDTTNSPFNARALLYEIRQRTDLPVRYVINTSATPDMMLGNESFVDFKPVILSTPGAAQAMREYRNEFPVRIEGDWRLEASMRGIHPTPPTQTFKGKETTLPLGGQTIKVINLGDNTAPGDAAVYLPQSKVLFLGDVFENDYIPRIGVANVENWIKTLNKVESWNVDIYVPGHGHPAGRAQVVEFRHFLQWLTGQVRSGIQKGKTLKQIQNALVPFQNYHWHAPELESEAVAGVYRSLTKPGKKSTTSATSASTSH